MKIKSMMAAMLAALTLAACSSDGEKDGAGKIPTGEAASLEISVTLPLPLSGKADPTQAATDEESFIDDIYIYVFNTDGTPVSKGALTKLSITGSGMIPGTEANQYVTAVPIKTTSGDRIIYVGANDLPTSVTDPLNPPTEAMLLQQVEVQTALLSRDLSDDLESIVMFAKTEKVLVPDYYAMNEVELDMERAVARVITTSDDAVITKDWSAASAQDMDFNILDYFVIQDAKYSYLAPAFNSNGDPKTLIQGKTEAEYSQVLNPYKTSNYTSSTLPPYKDIVPDQPKRQELDGFYMGENVPQYLDNVARYGNTTYAWVRTQVEMDHGAVVNSTNDGIVYTGQAIDETSGFVLIRVSGGQDYICNPAEADAVGTFLTSPAGGSNDPDDVRMFEFKKSYVYYRVWMNRQQGGKKKYNVLRNQFIHLDIEDVGITPGDFGKGYPGDPDNPEIPTDPNDEDNENNPNPWTPDPEPIDEEDATLKVTITVKEWSYAKNTITLQ